MIDLIFKVLLLFYVLGAILVGDFNIMNWTLDQRESLVYWSVGVGAVSWFMLGAMLNYKEKKLMG